MIFRWRCLSPECFPLMSSVSYVNSEEREREKALFPARVWLGKMERSMCQARVSNLERSGGQ